MLSIERHKQFIKDFSNCKISGDLLVIYKIDDNTLYLVRIGSHSQLFG